MTEPTPSASPSSDFQSDPVSDQTPALATSPDFAAHRVIETMYDAINRRDLDTAIAQIDPNCQYQDLNFPQPFVGREAVRHLFEESCQGIPDDLLFIIDEITTGDALSVGILWHVELGGIPFPNGRGVSFYRLSAKTGQVIFARDIVEPPFKPGHAAFFIIRLVTPLVRRFMGSADPSATPASSPRAPELPSSRQTGTAVLFGAIALLYTYVLLLSPSGQLLPGDPAWNIQPDTVKEVLDESINFFFVLPILNGLGVTTMQAPVVHPMTEALFNLAEAWIFMFLPLLLLDRRGDALPKRVIWGMAMFLTNVFLTPYMALRAAAPMVPSDVSIPKDRLARVFGWIGLIVGTGAIAWGILARPEFGGWVERSQYFLEQLTMNRVAIAFCVDLTLFALFQAMLMSAIEPRDSKKRWLRFIPFWGLALWLIV